MKLLLENWRNPLRGKLKVNKPLLLISFMCTLVLVRCVHGAS